MLKTLTGLFVVLLVFVNALPDECREIDPFSEIQGEVPESVRAELDKEFVVTSTESRLRRLLRRNLAFSKIPAWGAVLTSTYNSNYPAQDCIDGDYYDMCIGGSSSGDTLTIILSKTATVNTVRIINRVDCCRDRVGGAEVKAGNTHCGFVPHTTPMGAVQFAIHCPDVKTNFITITTTGHYLNLGEIEVYGSD